MTCAIASSRPSRRSNASSRRQLPTTCSNSRPGAKPWLRTPSARRVVVAAWPLARQQFAAVTAERNALREELHQVRADRDELRQRLIELLDAIRKRRAAEEEVARLHRLR